MTVKREQMKRKTIINVNFESMQNFVQYNECFVILNNGYILGTIKRTGSILFYLIALLRYFITWTHLWFFQEIKYSFF